MGFKCGGWGWVARGSKVYVFVSSLGVHVRRYVSWHCGSYNKWMWQYNWKHRWLFLYMTYILSIRIKPRYPDMTGNNTSRNRNQFQENNVLYITLSAYCLSSLFKWSYNSSKIDCSLEPASHHLRRLQWSSRQQDWVQHTNQTVIYA